MDEEREPDDRGSVLRAFIAYRDTVEAFTRPTW